MLVVLNPCSSGAAAIAPGGYVLDHGLEELETRSALELRTLGDGEDAERIGALIRSHAPAVVVAAGGDGTVREVVQSLMAVDPARRPALGILPLGTANNAARSLGLPSLRHQGEKAIQNAARIILAGSERRIDVGRAGSRFFIGSLAFGMDADILALRNRLCRFFGLGRRGGGYPLYLASCAANVLRGHGGSARLRLEAAGGTTAEELPSVYNLLLTNTPIYAGEFRFAADDDADDGSLDLRVFTDVLDYLRHYPKAWRRHVRHSRGFPVQPAEGLRRVRDLAIEWDRPVSCQLDGEEIGALRSVRVEVIQQAIAVRVPPTC